MNLTKKTIYNTVGALALLFTTAIPTFADSLIYVPMGSENNILIVENATGEITGKIEDLASVHGLAGTPDGKILVAASYEEREMGGETPEKPEGVSEVDHAVHHPGEMGADAAPKIKTGDMVSIVSIISTETNKVIRAIDVPGSVHHVEISADGKYAVVTHTNAGRISVIDLSSYEITATLSTGDMPNYAQFSPDVKKLYVSNAGNNTVSIIDTENWIVERNIIVGKAPEHMVISKDGKTLSVANVRSGDVSVVSLPSATIVKTLDAGEKLHGIAFSDDEKKLFVAIRDGEKLVAFNTETYEKTQVSLAPSPYHITNIKGTDELYVSSAGGDKIFVVDKETLKTIKEIDVGARAHQMVQVKKQ